MSLREVADRGQSRGRSTSRQRRAAALFVLLAVSGCADGGRATTITDAPAEPPSSTATEQAGDPPPLACPDAGQIHTDSTGKLDGPEDPAALAEPYLRAGRHVVVEQSTPDNAVVYVVDEATDLTVVLIDALRLQGWEASGTVECP